MNMIRKILLDQSKDFWLNYYNTAGLSQVERNLAGLMLNEISAMNIELRAAEASSPPVPVAQPVTEPHPAAQPRQPFVRAATAASSAPAPTTPDRGLAEVDAMPSANFPQRVTQ